MSSNASPLHARVRRRWPQAGRGQKWLLAGSAAAIVGSFLPWLELAFGARLHGVQGAGLWTFYLGSLGLAGALVPSRWAAIVQGAVCAAAAVGLPVLQVLRVFQLGLEGWQPGIGAVLVVAGGGMAARGVVQLMRDGPLDPTG